MDPRARTLSKTHGFDDIVLTRHETRKKPVGAFGLLACSPDHAPNEDELRIVAAMPIGEDGFQLILPAVNWSFRF